MPLHLIFLSSSVGATGLRRTLDEPTVRSAIHDAVTHQRTAQLVFDQQVIVEYVAEIDGSWTYWYHPEVFGNANAS